MNDITTIESSRDGERELFQLVPEIISDRALLSPDALAITDGAQSLTYRDLNDRAHVLGDILRSCGVGPDVVVGLFLPRSPATVVGALGILKAGGAYLPLDPAHPAARLAVILDDADVSVVVAASNLGQRIGTARSTISLNTAGHVVHSPEPSRSTPEEVTISSQNLAYVIYTSGSTGEPKGVEITHESLSNLVRWHLDAFAVTPADRASHIAGVAFDASVWEIWPHLAAGAALHLASEETVSDPLLLRDWLVEHKVTISFVPTPLAEHLLRLPWPSATSLRTMLTGGDTLRVYPPPGLPFSLINNYGPTECTVVATSGLVNSRDSSHRLPPIGSAIFNTQVSVLDESGSNLPPGTPGELHIAGPGLARGYRNRPQLTATRFISDPNNSGERLFKTGDRGKALPDGRIIFLGRIDEQVKVRGFRVEPNEIAATLNRHPDVQQSVVVAREVAPGDIRLIAYFVAVPDGEPALNELRDFLIARLPDYMMPAMFIKLERLLLTPNGKVDRNSLPEPNEANMLRERVPTGPRTEMEQLVADILGHLLKVERIDVEEDFFSLGGHSLLGAQLVARLRDRFHIEVPLRLVFEAPSVANLSSAIERLCQAREEPPKDVDDIFDSTLPAAARAMSQ